MITEALLNFLHSIAAGLFGWLHDHLPDPPSFWSDMTDALSIMVGTVSNPLRYFLPIVPLLYAGYVLTGLWIASSSFRLVRRVVSLFTGGGGS